MEIHKKPVKRSRLRLYIGKKYYTLLTYLKWYSGGTKYAKKIQHTRLPYTVFSHKTLLLRKLKNVDMKYQNNKIINLSLALKKINGLILNPGETFSFWKSVGKLTYGKGYVDGLVLNFDGTFSYGAGGGICQLSNMIYWISLHTPLTVTSRYRHSHDVFPDSGRSQPFGSGATVVYNYIDLQIFNGSDVTYQLALYIDEDMLAGEWRTTKPLPYKYEVYEKEHYISGTYWGGYIRNNKIYRKIYSCSNQLLDDEYVTENHAIMMYQPLIDNYTEGLL